MTDVPLIDRSVLPQLRSQGLADIFQSSSRVELRRNAVLSQPGKRIEWAYVVESGLISLLTTSAGYEPVQTGLIGGKGIVNGEIVFGAKEASVEAIVMIEGEGRKLSIDRALSLINEYPSVREFMLQQAGYLLLQARQNAFCQFRHSIEARLCRSLLHASDHSNGRPLCLTQEFLARMLGIQRTSLNAIASALARRNLIRTTRGKIEILDPSELQELACDCYSAG